MLIYRLLEHNGREVSYAILLTGLYKTVPKLNFMFQVHLLTLVPLKLCNELLDTWPDLASLFNKQLSNITDTIDQVYLCNDDIAGHAEDMDKAENVLEKFFFSDVIG